MIAPVSATVTRPRDRPAAIRCYASPTIGTPLQAAAQRDGLPEFRASIDAGLALVAPHLLLELAIRGLIAGITGMNEGRGDQLVIETLPFENTLALEAPLVPAPVSATPA